MIIDNLPSGGSSGSGDRVDFEGLYQIDAASTVFRATYGGADERETNYIRTCSVVYEDDNIIIFTFIGAIYYLNKETGYNSCVYNKDNKADDTAVNTYYKIRGAYIEEDPNDSEKVNVYMATEFISGTIYYNTTPNLVTLIKVSIPKDYENNNSVVSTIVGTIDNWPTGLTSQNNMSLNGGGDNYHRFVFETVGKNIYCSYWYAFVQYNDRAFYGDVWRIKKYSITDSGVVSTDIRSTAWGGLDGVLYGQYPPTKAFHVMENENDAKIYYEIQYPNGSGGTLGRYGVCINGSNSTTLYVKAPSINTESDFNRFTIVDRTEYVIGSMHPVIKFFNKYYMVCTNYLRQFLYGVDINKMYVDPSPVSAIEINPETMQVANNSDGFSLPNGIRTVFVSGDVLYAIGTIYSYPSGKWYYYNSSSSNNQSFMPIVLYKYKLKEES